MMRNRFPPMMDLTLVKQQPPILEIGQDVEFGRFVIINVTEKLVIKSGSKIRDFCRIEGRDITIGKNFVMNHHAEIGGGSCFEKKSSLVIGDNCHLGSYSIINTARKVTIGDEVGMGRFSNLYTHGAWLNPLEGFPMSYGEITIGNKVWIPGATILPDTHIGNNVVISQGAKVQGIIKDGSHIKQNGDLISNVYPKELTIDEKQLIIKSIMESFTPFPGLTYKIKYPKLFINTTNGDSVIDLDELFLSNTYSYNPGVILNHLRRHGIRIQTRADLDG